MLSINSNEFIGTASLKRLIQLKKSSISRNLKSNHGQQVCVINVLSSGFNDPKFYRFEEKN